MKRKPNRVLMALAKTVGRAVFSIAKGWNGTVGLIAGFLKGWLRTWAKRKPCLNCGAKKIHNNSFCSPECCHDWKAADRIKRGFGINCDNCKHRGTPVDASPCRGCFGYSAFSPAGGSRKGTNYAYKAPEQVIKVVNKRAGIIPAISPKVGI